MPRYPRVADGAEITDANTYATGLQLTARRLLAGAAAIGSDVATSPLTPTITLGTNGAATTIVGGIRIAPRRLSATTIDSSNDPHFEFVGAIPGRLLVSSGDMCYADLLTGGATQARRNHPRIKFAHTGQAFEAYFRTRAATLDYRIWVDGLPLTTALQSVAVAVPGRYFLRVDFGAVGTRQIEMEVVDPEFGGVVIGPTDSIVRTKAAPLLLAGFGDSHTAGANGVSWIDTWVRRTANQLRCEWVNLGIGGSGFLNGGGAAPDYRTRVTPDIAAVAPDVLVLEGSWNDSASSVPALTAEASFVYQAVKAALPTTLLVAAGPWVVSHTLAATLDSFDAALRAASAAAGWHGYISYRDPLGLKGSAPAWTATTVYAVGDTVVQNGFAQTCVTAHTSTGTFDQTKWRSTALVTGTGRVGTTAGDGSADVLVTNDGVHSTALGHQVKARHVAAELARIAATITR